MNPRPFHSISFLFQSILMQCNGLPRHSFGAYLLCSSSRAILPPSPQLVPISAPLIRPRCIVPRAAEKWLAAPLLSSHRGPARCRRLLPLRATSRTHELLCREAYSRAALLGGRNFNLYLYFNCVALLSTRRVSSERFVALATLSFCAPKCEYENELQSAVFAPSVALELIASPLGPGPRPLLLIPLMSRFLKLQ